MVLRVNVVNGRSLLNTVGYLAGDHQSLTGDSTFGGFACLCLSRLHSSLWREEGGLPTWRLLEEENRPLFYAA